MQDDTTTSPSTGLDVLFPLSNTEEDEHIATGTSERIAEPSDSLNLPSSPSQSHEPSPFADLEPEPSEPRGRQPPQTNLQINQRSRKRKKAFRDKTANFIASLNGDRPGLGGDSLLLDLDDEAGEMDGHLAASKKDKLDVMNRVIEDRGKHEGLMRGAIEMVSLASPLPGSDCSGIQRTLKLRLTCAGRVGIEVG